jgi:hypothetical protein
MVSISRAAGANRLNRAIHSKLAPQFCIQEFCQAPAIALSATVPSAVNSMRFVNDNALREARLAPHKVEIEVRFIIASAATYYALVKRWRACNGARAC